MANVLTIYNQALGHVGEPLITDPTESPVCDLYYPEARDACLSWAPWTFATIRQELERMDDSTVVTNDFAHQYKLPTQPPLLRTVNVDMWTTSSGRVGVGRANMTFRREVYVDPQSPDTQQPVLLTDADEVVLQYIGRVSEAIFPPLFTVCLALWLAADISQVISRKASLRAELFQEAQVKLNRLALVDSHQDSPRHQEMDRRYVAVRDRTGRVVPFTGREIV